MKYRGIFEYEYPTEHKPPVSIDVHLHGDCVKGKIIEWEYRPLDQEPTTKNNIPHCQCTDAEIAKSFIEDVEAVKDQLPTTTNDLGVDAISREQAINEFCIYNSYDSIGVDKVRSYLKALPSVTPQEPKIGHWIDDTRLGYHVSVCSNCNWRGHGDTCLIYKPKYCPNCGSYMYGVEPQESEVEDGNN